MAPSHMASSTSESLDVTSVTDATLSLQIVSMSFQPERKLPSVKRYPFANRNATLSVRLRCSEACVMHAVVLEYVSSAAFSHKNVVSSFHVTIDFASFSSVSSG